MVFIHWSGKLARKWRPPENPEILCGLVGVGRKKEQKEREKASWQWNEEDESNRTRKMIKSKETREIQRTRHESHFVTINAIKCINYVTRVLLEQNYIRENIVASYFLQSYFPLFFLLSRSRCQCVLPLCLWNWNMFYGKSCAIYTWITLNSWFFYLSWFACTTQFPEFM